MDTNDVVAVEKQVGEIIGSDCWFEYARYDGAKRLDEEMMKVNHQSDGLLREKLNTFPQYYHNDYLFYLKTNGGNIVSNMRLYQLPGCCGVAVSSASMVYVPYRQKGLNTILNKFRIELAKHMKYSVLMCSDLAGNIPSKKTLAKNGWKDIFQFKNQRTNNVVDISVINLT